MTSLNPSHNPFRTPGGRHAQAVHEPTASSSSFPEKLPAEDDSESIDSDLGDARRRGRRQGRQRIQRGMVPVPDLRFEQSFLLSIRPFLTPRPTAKGVQERGAVDGKTDSKSLVTSTESDEVFHWGRQVDVDWRMVSWVTIRDQILSPLAQGAMWGVLGLFLASSSAALRSALYPASHTPRGRITGGPGGKLSEAGGGGAVGSAQEGAWWRRFVGSWAGAVETATA